MLVRIIYDFLYIIMNLLLTVWAFTNHSSLMMKILIVANIIVLIFFVSVTIRKYYWQARYLNSLENYIEVLERNYHSLEEIVNHKKGE